MLKAIRPLWEEDQSVVPPSCSQVPPAPIIVMTKLLVALALSAPAALAQPHHMLGENGHGIWSPTPACCSVSAAADCVRTHPCAASGETDVEGTHQAFMEFVTKFEKKYATVEEWAHRLTVFAQNAARVAAHDAKALGYEVSLASQFADWTEEEFEKYQTLHSRPKPSQAAGTHEAVGDVPVEVDWRTKGVVAAIKNQGSCGSCWTFSTVVSIEGAHAKKTGDLVTLSEQNLVDCAKGDKIDGGDECCMGCSGGLMDNAFDYLIKKQDGGIATEDSYAYTGKDGTCAFDGKPVGAKISNWTDVAVGDEVALADAVANAGPVSIALDASKQWQLYSGGILKPRSILGCSSDPNHADHGVAIVGYGTDDGVDYWWIRNSWGESWGESGYMRLERGVNACGVANFASYPIAA